jgi:hypothetical protein
VVRTGIPVRLKGFVYSHWNTEQNKSGFFVRANHPFIPSGTSYFEVKIRELGEPEYMNEQ